MCGRRITHVRPAAVLVVVGAEARQPSKDHHHVNQYWADAKLRLMIEDSRVVLVEVEAEIRSVSRVVADSSAYNVKAADVRVAGHE